MIENEAPIYGDLGKPGAPSEAQLDKLEESIRIIEHVQQFVRKSGVMVYLAPHEPLEVQHHTPDEYRKIANQTVRRAVLANRTK